MPTHDLSSTRHAKFCKPWRTNDTRSPLSNFTKNISKWIRHNLSVCRTTDACLSHNHSHLYNHNAVSKFVAEVLFPWHCSEFKHRIVCFSNLSTGWWFVLARILVGFGRAPYTYTGLVCWGACAPFGSATLFCGHICMNCQFSSVNVPSGYGANVPLLSSKDDAALKNSESYSFGDIFE